MRVPLPFAQQRLWLLGAAVALSIALTPDLPVRTTLTLLAVTAVLFAALARVNGRADARTAAFVALSVACLLLLAHLAASAALAAVMVALALLGGRLPPAWLRVLAVPLSALMLIALDHYRFPISFSDLIGGVGFFAILSTGFAFTRLREREAALAHANAQLAERAQQDAELSRLRERERLARDLHDTLGHALSTLTVQLEAARRLTSRHPERAATLLGDAQTLTRTAMRDLRDALDDLRSTPDASLPDMAGALARTQAEHAGWHVTVDVPDVPLAPQTITALRPVLAEALHNAARHARATHVTVRADVTAGTLTLTVEDDGVGLTGTPAPAGHYGLTGMRERLRALGGTLDVAGAPGGGTRVTARVPLSAHPPLTPPPEVPHA
ncbi:sensor histidine kinase [Deinococcus maricopensis]|uniref:Integral membrane sensor signal transduction histidine kinase n=1 Tax=Deinococcus maricopensis (strain DSM 21211 / LMG 22137 / NRRL B-23946 / LB-34) TaxID=709986 RepID=E8UBM0_DEIML|nr:sensor histidine kinase [Deinococcus maricopensis]ADV68459.1 integral membrane sensor signal transduction histidine kinase [Deinococcus maricopensis DSM 21211]